MGLEIERKFLLKNDDWKASVRQSITMCQGYVMAEKSGSVRIRIAGDKAYLTLKSGKTGSGFSRSEFEYNIPVDDAREMLHSLCRGGIIEKIRHIVPAVNGMKWEIDEFQGLNEGLVLAEIELPSEETPFVRPPWLGDEVTDDPRYTNGALSKSPWRNWAH